MAAAVKIRLVRCPKCWNILTELPDFSLYECGGCGAVLQAKKKGVIKARLTETSDDVKGIRTAAECNIYNMSDLDMESADGIGRAIVEKYDKEIVTSIGNSMSRFGNGEPLADFDASRRGKERIRRPGYYDDEKKSYTQGLVHQRNHDEFSDLNINTPEYGNFQGEQRRFGSFPYHDMGPSSYEINSHYEHTEGTRFNDQGLYGFARVEKLEHDRFELLRKLDELKDQLNRSWDMDDKLNERMASPIQPDSYGRLHNANAQEGLNRSHGINKMSLSANDLESPYLSHIHGHSPHMRRFVSGIRDSYSPRDFPHESRGFRPPRQSPYGRMHHPNHEDVRGYYSETSPDRRLHQHGHFLHHPSCSCEHCCNRNLYIHPNIDHFKSLHQPNTRSINYHPNPVLHASRGYSSGGSTLHSRQSPTLNSADLDYENESFDSHRHRKVDASHGRGRLCHPILGGAPFITCCNCFELLKLPGKHLSLAKKRKIKCGSCFSVFIFELGIKGYVVSVSSHGDPISTDVDVGSNKADIQVCPNECEFTDKSNYDKPKRQLDPLFSISNISENKHNTHRGDKSNFDEPKKQLHPPTDSNIMMDKHNVTNKSNCNDPEKLIDPINKSNYDGFGKQLDSLSSTSSSSVDQHYIETDHKSSFDHSKKQVDPLSAMSIVSVGNHDPGTEKKSNYGESEKQVDSHFATPSISVDEHITDTDQRYDDESRKQLDTNFSTPSISTDKHITEDNLNSDKSEKQLNPLSGANVTSEKHYNLPEEYHVHSSRSNVSQFDEGAESNPSELALDQATTSQISANDSARATETGVSVTTFSDRCISNYSGEISEDNHQLHPPADSDIMMDKHNVTNKSNCNDPEKLIDLINKSNYDGFGKQLDCLSSTSSSSVGQHYIETDHKSSFEQSKKQVDPLSAMSIVSVGNHDPGTEKKSNYGESEKQVDTHFATPSISVDEHITDTDQRYDDESRKQLDTNFSTVSISTDKHITEDNLNSDKSEKQLNPLSGANVTSEKHYNLPEEYHVHSSRSNVSQFDEGAESNPSELALDQATTSQISANDLARATETGVSVNTFSNRCISNYSGEISEDDHPRVNAKGESFVVGATEKSTNDTSDYEQSLEFNESIVFVNGHFIPNRDVKKAEKLAGPIQPGEYWYDIQAGFWGVMGCPCLGIIMPNIEEFNYPLPGNCGAGNTGVLVNGRELHQKDLDILAGRGLPILKHGSYVIDISGKVVDEHTGEELDSLGKLAPTVEREKRGFGMRVP